MFYGLMLPPEALGAERPRAAEPAPEAPLYRSEAFAEDLPAPPAPARAAAQPFALPSAPRRPASLPAPVSRTVPAEPAGNPLRWAFQRLTPGARAR